MKLVRVLSAVAGVVVLLGFLGVVATIAADPAEQGPAKEAIPAEEEFSTDLAVLQGVGLAAEGQGHRVLLLHVEEDNWDSVLYPYFLSDPVPGKDQPIWQFPPGRGSLVLTHPSHDRLLKELADRLHVSGVLKDERIDPDIRVLVTQHATFTQGVRKQDNENLELMCRWVHRVDALPFSLNPEIGSGPGQVGWLPELTDDGQARLVEKLEVLGLKPDGTARLRYGGQEFVLPPGKRWPAPLRGRTVSAEKLMERLVKVPKGSPEKLARQMKARVERIFGDQMAVRLTTKVDILNRGIVTVRLGDEGGKK